ncbi:uncharacterized protein LOC125883445 [Epinephelus fuscoguttatus]|uniref:uncharacterized protein LOC125883445 n=1 Tax=Epinephelus fuscoguttatus TaxID=293821 RepID=UPI0020D18D72|nr:uncharacterized protein LOC125883445 [Epinephelus fuscoguttatus]
MYNYWGNVGQYFYQTSRSPAAIKYHGLSNQGATCYLNSVLQVLFMTEDFREAVKQHKQENPDTECIDCHLTPLFDDLEQHEAYTFKITNTLGIKRVYEQQDAAECFEKILGLTSPEASKIFRGQLTRTTECSTCHNGTNFDGAFWHLPLELVESYSEDYSVVNGIEEFFRDSHLSGENQMYCDKCDDKSDAKIKCAIKDHPEVLMLLLKRFEFDYQYMAYVKINCTVAVPYTLQIPGNQTYELYAVVDHSGDLRSGHYTATIKSQDDDKWYNFNDSRVTLRDYQPFQMDKFEKSSSAYLLFYRKKKMHAADTCPQDITEVSTPGGFPPADADIYYQCQDVIEMRETENVEVAEDVSNEPAVAVSIDTNEEAGIKDITPGVRGAKPSGVPYSIGVEGQGVNVRQTLSYNQQECDEERKDVRYHPQDAHAEKQKYDRKVVTGDEEDIGGNSESDNEAEKRGTSSRETQLEESVDDWDSNTTGVDGVRHQESLEGDDIHDPSYQRYKQEFSNMHVRCDGPQQVCVDMQRDEDRMVVDINRDKDREMEGNEHSEWREKSSAKHLNRDAEHHEDKEFDVRKDTHGDLEGTQDVEQDYLKPVSADRQGDRDRMEIDYNVEKKRKSGEEKLLTIYDLCKPNNTRVGDSQQNMPKQDQGCRRRISSRFDQSHEQQREHKRDVRGEERSRGDDKYAQMRETSMRKPQPCEDVERGSESVRQNRSEHVTHTTPKDVVAAKQAKEQEKKGDKEHNQTRADSSRRRERSAGSSRLTEGVGSVEKSHPQARTGSNEYTMKEGRGSEQKHKIYYVKRTEEEFRETNRGVQSHRETMKIATIEVASQDRSKSVVKYDEGNVKRKSDPKTDAKAHLSEGVCSLNLNDSPLPKPERHSTKQMSDVQAQAGIQYALQKTGKKKTRFWRSSSPLKQNRKAKKKRKTVGCFAFFRRRRKNADQTSKSD